MSSAAPPVQITGSDEAPIDLEERVALALRLIDAVCDGDDRLVKVLVNDEHADCWIQDAQGWTALHAAARACLCVLSSAPCPARASSPRAPEHTDTGSVEHIKLLLRKGNAVWSIPDNLGCVRLVDLPFHLRSVDVPRPSLTHALRLRPRLISCRLRETSPIR